MLVTADVSPVWHVELGERCVAAVQDVVHPMVGGMRRRIVGYEQVLQARYARLPAGHQLLNSGVMVMDLERCRREDMTERAYAFLRRHPQLTDQDALNDTLAWSWQPLDVRWNLQSGWQHPETLADSDVRRQLERVAAPLQDAAVVHFTGVEKPWMIGLRRPLTRTYRHAIGDSGWFTPLEFQAWRLRWFAASVANELKVRVRRHRL